MMPSVVWAMVGPSFVGKSSKRRQLISLLSWGDCEGGRVWDCFSRTLASSRWGMVDVRWDCGCESAIGRSEAGGEGCSRRR